jgi:threonylcarbamoyladenosine tRNA methylthiotransferase MtaB
MFENTLNLVKEASLSFLHIFPYSEREGTPAAKMPQVPVNIRKKRAAALREAGKEVLNSNMVAQIGKKLQFIVEGNGTFRSEEFYTAKYSGNYHNMVGEIITATVVGVQDNNLVVEI